MPYEYRAVRFYQRAGKEPAYLMAAPARQIVKWADAPHKKTSLRAGYQRELDENRLRNIKSFLEISEDNLLPSAALIAVREEDLEVVEDGDCCLLRITNTGSSTAESRLQVVEALRARLSDDELASVGLYDQDSDALEDLDEGEALEGDDEPASEPPPDSYLASLYKELTDYDGLNRARRAEIDEFVLTMSTAGLIIDGQHRIFGAKEATQDIAIPVVLLPGLSLSEQVFNFYVLNNKAKPLDKRQLRSIISTSLTKAEIDALYDRFNKSGLNATAAQWTYRVHSEIDSPFRGLISLRLNDDTAPIDDNIMDQVVSRFIRMPRRFSPLKRGIRWEDDPDFSRRLSLFYALWRAVKETYPEAWSLAEDGKGQLFTKVSMLQLQEFVLEVLKQAVRFRDTPPLSSAPEMFESTKTALEPLPEAFFLREWKRKSLDTNVGRKFFLEQMQAVAAADGKGIGHFSLFKSSEKEPGA